MRIIDITNEGESLHNLLIYVDLDGVLVDFNKFAREVIGCNVADFEADKQIKRLFWSRVNNRHKEGKPFFGAMDPLPDVFVLWDYVKKYDPIILSATGRTKNAGNEKRDWVKRHLGQRAADTALFVESAQDKAQYANRNSILIDDRTKAIQPWIDAGGIGIHHISASDSIQQLKKLGL